MPHRDIASKVAVEFAAEESTALAIDIAHDGRMFIRCRICPKKVCDIRGKGNRAFSSSHVVTSVEEAEEWFDAHRRTDMHAYYRDDPPKRAPSDEDRILAQVFKKAPPEPTVIPFKYAKRYR